MARRCSTSRRPLSCLSIIRMPGAILGIAGWPGSARRRFGKLNLPPGWSATQNTEPQRIPSQHGPDLRVRYIPYIHPEAIALTRTNPNFRFCERSVFDATPGTCDVLRTMNIFNRDYFSEQQLTEGVSAAFQSLQPGGLWIVGRTLEEDFTNHATFFRRNEQGFEVLERIGSGSEMEALALSLRQIDDRARANPARFLAFDQRQLSTRSSADRKSKRNGLPLLSSNAATMFRFSARAAPRCPSCAIGWIRPACLSAS